LLIPVLSGIVGWATNVLALKMTFYPIEFFPSFMSWSQIPGQPVSYFLLAGWQGIIPSKADKMAQIMTELITTSLIDIQETFEKLNPAKMAAELREGVEPAIARVIEDVAMAEMRSAWIATPPHVKQEINAAAAEHIEEFVVGFVKEMQVNIYEVFDIVGMNVRLARERKDKIVHMFQVVGAQEFTFIERSGIYFGFLFGCVQAAVYAFYKAPWVLPAFGFAVGWMTNYLALLLIFKPVRPRRVGCFSVHGAFMRRQSEVAETFSDVLVRVFINADNIWDEIQHGAKKEKFDHLLREYTASFVNKTVGVSQLLLGAMVGEEGYKRITARIVDGVVKEFGGFLPYGYQYSDQAMGIQETLKIKLRALPPEQFEGVLHPAFEEDEIKLILVGGVLGLAVGLLQEYVMFAS